MRFAYVIYNLNNRTTSNLTHLYLVMVAETVSLGVLSLPAAVATLGLVPYVIQKPDH
jgi:hypothetical protein